MVSHFAPLWQGDMAQGNIDSTQSFFNMQLGKHAKGVFLQAQLLSTNSNSIPFPQYDPPTHKHLLHSLNFGYAKEYSWAVHTLAPFSLAPTSFNTTSALTTLHPKSNGYFSLFLENYEPNQDHELSYDSFKLAFQCMPHLSTSGPSGMIF